MNEGMYPDHSLDPSCILIFSHFKLESILVYISEQHNAGHTVGTHELR